MLNKTKLLHELTSSLQPVQRAWKRAVGKVIADYGISMSLTTVIVLIHRNSQGMNQKLLADEMGINPGALVRLVDQASSEAYIERRCEPGDRRSKILHILPKGKKLAVEIEQLADELRLELMKDVEPELIHKVSEVLRLFEKRANEYTNSAEN
ncbi:MarR family transcriptional regulator [Pseudoalteromonas sp. N1230-9]|uniref:MarR family winged helix-turn-helix transcriptional regulator n=1 Tax=Pseudoalteromonas sp. N1230-9 TaxID=2907156 RepID=UPI002B303609|nr:MarR family transcriptional regulator [Pseudoalteromonas sp. N1230-9]